MATITKDVIMELAEPFEQIYGDITQQILVLLADELGKDIDLPIEQWKQKKVEAINSLLLKIQAILRDENYSSTTTQILSELIELSLEDVEPQLKKASELGILTKNKGVNKSERISVLKKLTKENFLNKFNDMNNVIQNTTLENFNNAISLVTNIYDSRRTELLDQVINSVWHKETIDKALEKALTQLSKEGISGFVDKLGRKWSAEAYASMYTRTNIHNTATSIVVARNNDYDNDLFTVSKHAGARPLCAPWQGKIVSTDNRRGTTIDGNGKKVKFIPLSSTSYGEPAGLLGINCGHELLPFIPNISFDDIKPLSKEEKKKNDKQYAESQQQRAIERKIRKLKTDKEMLKSVGLNTQDIDTALCEADNEMKTFLKQTGRTRRKDREVIYTEKGAK